jgi:hypothetical protein
MPNPVSDNQSVHHSCATPNISTRGHLVTGSGFLPDHNVALRITRAGEDISDYLTYMTDGDGYLHCELPTSAAGTVYIAATDHRPDPEGACGRLWSNTYTLVVADRVLGRKPRTSVRGEPIPFIGGAERGVQSGRAWPSMYCLMNDSEAPPQETAK